jgi:hypothetical protein
MPCPSRVEIEQHNGFLGFGILSLIEAGRIEKAEMLS